MHSKLPAWVAAWPRRPFESNIWDRMVDFVIGMYKNEEARYGVLSFFELV